MKKNQPDLAKLEQEKQEYLDGWKRAKADLINLQSRMNQEQIERSARMKKEWLLKLLPVHDNFTRAEKEIPQDQKQVPWVEGVELIKKQLDKLLQDEGLIEIESKGKKFDPAFHQPLAQIATADIEPQTILDVIEPGYLWNGSVLRPAKVTIASAPTNESTNNQQE